LVVSLAIAAAPMVAVAQDAEPTLVSEACQAANIDGLLKNPGRLTLSTDNPAFPPWWTGDPREQYPLEPEAGSGWEYSPDYPTGDPYSQQGYESAVAWAIAAALGFAPEQVDWIPNAVFEVAFQPGPKPFDFHMAQIAINDERAQSVDFTDSYFDANQSLIALADNDITSATSIADLKDDSLGAAVATTSFQFIENVIQPDVEPQVFNDNAAAIQALQNGQIDGLVVDLQSGFFMTAVQLTGGTIVGQFQSSAEEAEKMGIVLEKDSPLTACVNEAIALLRDSGQLQDIYDATISTDQDVPVLE
jgi:polar amino acid transport system substrate-binding protein